MNSKLHNVLFPLFMLAVATPGIFPRQGISSEKSPDVLFDTDIIRKRGFDPRIAAQFQKATQFPEGTTRVTLVLNGQRRGKVTAKFVADGRLCLTTSLLREAGLRLPAILPERDLQGCIAPSALWQQQAISVSPDTSTLTMTVPQSALADQTEYADWEHGGTAGIFNYNSQYLVSEAPASRFSFWQMQTEAGFNTRDWIVRSNQNWLRSDDSVRFRHQSLWAEKTLYDYKSRFRAGLFTLGAGTSGVGRILGAQLTPETALYKDSGAAVVSSIADSPSAIEIRQSGVLLYSTTVPAGPFTIRHFSLLNTHTDLHVMQTGSDGRQREYTVPAAAYLAGGSTVTPGVSFGIGRWQQEGYRQHPGVVTISRGWQVFPRAGLQTDILYSSDYQSLGITSDIPLGLQAVSFSSVLMTSGAHRGGMSSLSVSSAMAENTSLSLNATIRNGGYRDFSEAMVADESGSRSRTQFGPTVSWYNALVGSFSLSWTRSKNSDGAHSDYAQLGWTRKAGKGYLSVTASRNNGGINHRQENMLYASWQIPFGEKNTLSNWVNNRGSHTRYGTRFTRRENNDTSWNISADHSRDDGATAFNAGINQVTRWSQLSGNLSYDSEHYRSLSLQGSGAAILHKRGFMLSPFRIEDTFAIVQAGRQEGIRIDTTSGAVRTDNNGYAVVPSLAGWGKTTLQIDTLSLKKNVDVINGVEEISVARGAVREVSFGLVSARRALVTAKTISGQPLPPRMNVFDEKNNFITVTGDDGTVFIPDARPDMRLVISLPESRTCRLELTGLPPRVDSEAGLYETTEATCEPDAANSRARDTFIKDKGHPPAENTASLNTDRKKP